MGYFFHFLSLYPAPYIELYMCKPIQISYLNFKAVPALPKTARSARTHKNISFIWNVWAFYMYISAATEPPNSTFFRSHSSKPIYS